MNYGHVNQAYQQGTPFEAGASLGGSSACASLPPANCGAGYHAVCDANMARPSWMCFPDATTEFWQKYRGWIAFATPIVIGAAVGSRRKRAVLGASVGAGVSVLGLLGVMRFGGYRG